MLLGLYGIYASVNTWKEVRMAHIVKELPLKLIWEDIIVFGLSFGAILLSARWLVISAIGIAKYFQIPELIVGLILIGFGNALPEITFTIKTVRKGILEMGLGNSVGSILVNVLLILGVAAVINPITFSLNSFLYSYGFMIITIILSIGIMKRKEITWKHGIFLITMYLIFLTMNILINGVSH